MSGTETRAEEIARVRSYLVSQAAKRTPEQLVETLREAERQFVAAVAVVPAATWQAAAPPGDWSVAEVVAHVREMALWEETLIGSILTTGAVPTPRAQVTAPAANSRETLLAEITTARERLFAVVLAADPDAHRDVTWAHAEFGALNWREWLLFARVHLLDHLRQIQALNSAA